MEVTVDDLFPCEPNGSPIFASGMHNEIWVLILEKAYAKVHGSYFLLKGGYVNEALVDLAGCPTSCYSLQEDQVQHFIQNGQFWELMKYFQTEGYLLSMTTPGEGRSNHHESQTADSQDRLNELPLGQGFAISQVIDLGDRGKLLCLRAPLGKFNWHGEWSDTSPKWTPEIVQQIMDETSIHDSAYQTEKTNHTNLNLVSDENEFWMSYEEAVETFTSLVVCRATNMHEIRMRGKFIRVQDF